MSYVDPIKVMRNPATLEAYRRHQRAVLAAAQPWLGIALAVLVLAVALLWFELVTDSLRRFSLVFSALTFAYALCFCVGAIRAWLYRRAHPLVLPEPPSVWGQGGKSG